MRKENVGSLEYVCPECGETFEEGAEQCSSCGLEFDWSEELEYLCPECGTVVDPDQDRCPGCAARFSKESNGDMLIEYEPDAEPPTVEELLEAAIHESIVHPVTPLAQVDSEPHPARRKGSPEAKKAKDADAPAAAPAPKPARPAAVHEEEDVPSAHPHLYPGGFTAIGMAFVVLAIMAFVFTLVMARYDTWVQGAAEESMGDNQRIMFFAGLLAFAVCIVVAIADLLRNPFASRSSD